jgi:hypothetical protein
VSVDIFNFQQGLSPLFLHGAEYQSRDDFILHHPLPHHAAVAAALGCRIRLDLDAA